MAAFSERRGQPLTLHPGPWFQCSSHSSITKTFEVSSSDQQIPCFIACCTKSLSSLLHIIYSPCRGKERRGISSVGQSGQVQHQHTPTRAQIPSLFNLTPLERNFEVSCSVSAQIPHISLLLTPPSIPPATHMQKLQSNDAKKPTAILNIPQSQQAQGHCRDLLHFYTTAVFAN